MPIPTSTENKSGIRGVDFRDGKWRARITKNYKSFYLGRFPTKEAAEAAYKRAALTIYGEDGTRARTATSTSPQSL